MILRIPVVIITTLMLSNLASAQIAPPAQNTAPSLEERKFQLERERTAAAQTLEFEKLKLERDKLDDDRNKTWVTISGAAAVLVVGIITLLGQLRLKRRDFLMKAAEIAMHADNATQTLGRAHALTILFGRSIPPNFGHKLNPLDYGDKYQLLAKLGTDGKKLRLARGAQRLDANEITDAIKSVVSLKLSDPASQEYLIQQWAIEIEARQRYYLAYVYEPSDVPGQSNDVTVFLMRHEWGKDHPNLYQFDNVERADFYFGPSWPGAFTAKPADTTGGIIGVRISAWGSFWATCYVKFSDDPKPIILHRLIDFLMPAYTDLEARHRWWIPPNRA